MTHDDAHAERDTEPSEGLTDQQRAYELAMMKHFTENAVVRDDLTSADAIPDWIGVMAGALLAARTQAPSDVAEGGLAERACLPHDDLTEQTIRDGLYVCVACGKPDGIEQPPTLGPPSHKVMERFRAARLLAEANDPERQKRDRERAIANARAADELEGLVERVRALAMRKVRTFGPGSADWPEVELARYADGYDAAMAELRALLAPVRDSERAETAGEES